MDHERFDALTRAFGTAQSRRGVLRILAGAMTGAFLPIPGKATAD